MRALNANELYYVAGGDGDAGDAGDCGDCGNPGDPSDNSSDNSSIASNDVVSLPTVTITGHADTSMEGAFCGCVSGWGGTAVGLIVLGLGSIATPAVGAIAAAVAAPVATVVINNHCTAAFASRGGWGAHMMER